MEKEKRGGFGEIEANERCIIDFGADTTLKWENKPSSLPLYTCVFLLLWAGSEIIAPRDGKGINHRAHAASFLLDVQYRAYVRHNHSKPY